MIKHIVLFQIKDIENKIEKCKEIKEALLGLQNSIPELKQIEVGINSNEKESFDICLNTLFDSFKDLDTYANHPKHLDVVKIVKEVVQGRACVDYEV